ITAPADPAATSAAATPTSVARLRNEAVNATPSLRSLSGGEDAHGARAFRGVLHVTETSRLRQAARHHEPALVGDHHELGAVARAELHEQPRDVGLRGERGDDELVGDLAVAEAGADEPEHLALARGELVQGGRRYERPLGRAREGLDQAPRDARGEQRVALGDDADGGEQIGRLEVLEQEPAGAGA